MRPHRLAAADGSVIYDNGFTSNDTLEALTYDSAGNVYTYGTDQHVRVWDAATGSLSSTSATIAVGGSDIGIAISPSEDKLLISRDDMLSVVDIATLTVDFDIATGIQHDTVAFDEFGNLFGGGGKVYTSDGQTLIADFSTTSPSRNVVAVPPGDFRLFSAP